MPGTTTTTYWDALNWGSGTAETANTLGTDRLDIRIPSDQYHTSHLQIARMKNLLISISEYMKGGARVRVLPQSSNPFSASESGFYVGDDGNGYVVFEGAATQIGIGGGGANTLQEAYDADIGDIALASGPGAFRLADASPTLGTIFSVTDSAFDNTYFGVSATAVTTLSGVSLGVGTSPATIVDISGPADTAALQLRSGASAAVSTASCARLAYNAGTNKLRVSLNGAAYTDIVTGSGTTTLQQAYDNGSDAELALDATGPIVIKDNATPLATRLFAVTDSADTADAEYFAVRADAIVGQVSGATFFQCASGSFVTDNPSNAVSHNILQLQNTRTAPGNSTGLDWSWIMKDSGNVARTIFEEKVIWKNAATPTTRYTLSHLGTEYMRIDSDTEIRFTAGTQFNVYAGAVKIANFDPVSTTGGSLGVSDNMSQQYGYYNSSSSLGGGLRINHYYDVVDARDEYARAGQAGLMSWDSGVWQMATAASGAANGAVTWSREQFMQFPRVTTSDATVTTIANFTLSTNTAYRVTARVVAMQGATNRAMYTREALVYRAGAGAVLEGSVSALSTVESNGVWDCTIDVNSNDVRVRVTGVAATSINWVCVLSYHTIT